MLKSWAIEPPPKSTWVIARYGVLDKDYIVKTCKRGCCVIDVMGDTMTLPKFWRLATESEILAVTGEA